MRTILILVAKDIAIFFRYRAALIMTFVLPVTLIYIFGQVWGLNRKDDGPSGLRLGVVNESANPAAQKLIDALKAEKAFRIVDQFDLPNDRHRPLTEADARTLIHNNDLRFALVIPPNLIAKDRFGLDLKILSNPQNQIETQTVNGLLQKTIFSNVPQLLGQALQEQAKDFLGAAPLDRFNRSLADTIGGTFGLEPGEVLRRIDSGDFGFSEWIGRRRGERPVAAGATTASSASSANAIGVLSRVVKIENEQIVGKDVRSPLATTIIGGQAVMFLLFALSGAAAAFFDERNAGKFQRLLSGPVSRADLLWSRFLFGVLIGLVQLTMLFLAGQLLFGVDVVSHLGKLLLVCTAAAAACSAFGMLIAAFASDALAATGISTFLVLTMSATGGAWFPISLMPEFMQRIGKFTPVYWSIEGFGRVLWAGNTLGELLPTLGILFGTAAAVMAIAIWRLNRKRIFE